MVEVSGTKALFPSLDGQFAPLNPPFPFKNVPFKKCPQITSHMVFKNVEFEFNLVYLKCVIFNFKKRYFERGYHPRKSSVTFLRLPVAPNIFIRAIWVAHS